MDRRAFLRLMGFGTVAAAAAATSVFDVEKLLWVPGEKTIFIPPPALKGHYFYTVDWMTAEALRILKQSMRLTQLMNREYTTIVLRPPQGRILTPDERSMWEDVA